MKNLQIDYVEFYSDTLEQTQDFFAKAFGWDFVDYGPNYRDIQGPVSAAVLNAVRQRHR